MKELICRLHVIIKYFGRNEASERFFPVMFIATWFNILLQSIAYITFHYFNHTNASIELSSGLNSESIKIILVGMLFLTVLTLFYIVNDKLIYIRAEEWYLTMPIDKKFALTFITIFLIFGSFFTTLIWAVYLM
ncbi:MAG: hypothetical protein COB38_11210 [Gammaproteobacteria bacterium]|nr:MAG: hypothetical protein COB38_11210 [Gammaproteobacteria bacterium]